MRTCSKCRCVAVARSGPFAVGERYYYCPYHWARMKLWVRAAKRRIARTLREILEGAS